MYKKSILGLVCIATIGILGACGNGEMTKSQSSQPTSSESSSRTSSESLQSPESINLADYQFKVSSDDAVAVFKEKHADATVTKIELDTDFGQYKYKVKGVNETTEYELKVDAETKEVTKEKEEPLDSDELNGKAKEKDGLSLDKVITPKKAIEQSVAAAEKESITGRVTEWSLENDNQQPVYEVKIVEGSNDVDVKIDAITGNIIEIER